MKKIIWNKTFLKAFVAIFAISFIGILSTAGAGTETIVSIQDCLVDAGESITVPIMIYNVTNMGDAEVNFSFNPSVVNVLSFSGGDFFPNLFFEIHNDVGWARVGGFIIFGNLSGDVVLADVTLQAVGIPGETSPLNFTKITIHDATPQGNEIPAIPQNGTFTINDTLPPEITNVSANPNPQEVNGYVNITCNVTDAGGVNVVKVNITYPDSSQHNFTMNTGSYYYNATYSILGTYYYFIWANDTSSNSNVSGIYSFTIIDTTPPEITNVSANPNPQEVNGYVNITCNVTDNVAVNVVKVNITYPDSSQHNFTMNAGSYYYNATYSMPGIYNYFIWVNDTSSNSNVSAVYSFYIYDPSVVYVDDDFNASTPGWQYDHFDKIQDGIDAVNEGGVVYIFNGTYNENVDVSKTVSIIGNDSASCIVQSMSNDDIFYISSDWVNISGLTVKDAQNFHAGIHLYQVSHCNISNVNASNNIYGIYLDSSTNNSLINNTAFFNDYYGIYLSYSDYNIFIKNNCSYNDYGIYLHFSDYNVLKNNTAMENNYWDLNIYLARDNTIENTTGSGNRPIAYYDSNVNIANATFSELILCNADSSVVENITVYGSAILDNNGIILSETDHATLTDINSSNNCYGVWLKQSHHNTLSNLTCVNGDTGIMLFTSDYNTISDSNFSNNEAGIYIYGYSQEGNAFYNNTAFNELYTAFYADDDSHKSVVENLTIASYPTRISFTFDNGIRIRGVDVPPPNPAGMGDIGKYVNITNVTSNSWINITIYYEDDDLGIVEEDTLRIWRYNGSAWEMVSEPNNVSIAKNYVYANITTFSIFAPLGELPTPVQNLRTGELFMTIQSAINDNDTIDGDTIIVYESVFRENVIVNKSLIIKAGSKPLIDGMGGVAISIVVDNVTVEGFDIINSSTGIYVHNASFTLHNITIRNCTIYDCLYQYATGIKFENVDNSTIEGCEIYNNTLWGIQLSFSSNNTIYNNTVYNHTSEWNSAGIVAFSSSNYNNISSNTVYNNGIDNIELWNNSFYNEIWNNTLYGGEYGILLSRNANNNTIAKNNIHGNTYGIGLGHSNTTWGGVANNNILRNNEIYDNDYGVYLYSSNSDTILHCEIYSNTLTGIYAEYCNELNVSQNNISFNGNAPNWNEGGIYFFHTNDSVIKQNYFTNDIGGAVVLWNSHNNTISQNDMIENCGNICGMAMADHSSNNTIERNNIANNTGPGIWIYGGANNNTILNNIIKENPTGVYLSYTTDSNLIYNNYFDNAINAYDNGNNIWNISKTAGKNIVGGDWLGGNFWHDYDGNDIDGDGLGDTNLPYNSGGNIQNGGDMHPLMARVYNLNQDRWYYYIQSAIDNASDGDVIIVHGGTYYENVLVDKEITLINGSKPLIDAMGGIAFNITANNVSIVGFNITNASYGVYCENVSGFYIANNTFWYDDYAIYWDIEKYDVGMNYTVYGITIEKNEFYMNKSYDVIYTYIDLDFANESYNATIENISMLNNIFYMNGTTACGINISGIYVENITNGSISAGMINISQNKFYGGYTAIDFYGYFDTLTNASVALQNFMVCNNTFINQSSYAIDIDYYDARYWYGNTTGIFWDLIINGNVIESDNGVNAIYVGDYAYWRYFSDNASLTTGNIYIQNNEIDAGGEAIYVDYNEGAYEFYDNASVVMGNAYIDGNKIYNSSDGIFVDVEDFGELCGNVSAEMGFIHIADNFINSSSNGIYIYYYDLGYDTCGNASVIIGETYILNNNINSSSNEAIYFHYEDVAYDMEDNSSLLMNDIHIENNNINSSSYAIYIQYYDEEVGYDMYDNSSARLPDYIIRNNTINASGDGIYVYTYENPYEIYDNSSFYFSGFFVVNNTFNCTDYGIYIEYDDFCYGNYDNSSTVIGGITISENTIHAGDDAIYIDYDDIGDDMNDNATLIVENVTINNNTISCSNGIFIQYNAESDEYAVTSIKFLNITENRIYNCSNDGINISYDLDANANSTLSIERAYVADNFLENCTNGIFIKANIYNESNSVVMFGGIVIDNNSISNCGGEDSGIHIENIDGNEIMNNTLYNCTYGIVIISSEENYVYNNIIFNTTAEDAYGIYLDYVNDSIFLNNSIFNYSMVTGYAYGIAMVHSNGNEFDGLNIHKLDLAVQQDFGIYLDNSSLNNFSNVEIYDLHGEYAYGIYLMHSDNNTFNITDLHNFSADTNYGIYLKNSNNNSFNSTYACNLSSTASSFGIYIYQSLNNAFNETFIDSVNASLIARGIHIETNSHGNNFDMLNINNVNGSITDGIYADKPSLWLYFNNVVIKNVSSSGYAHGIFLEGIDESILRNITIDNILSSNQNAYGIGVYNCNDNILYNTSISNITALNGDAIGIYLTTSYNNTFINTSLKNLDPVSDYDAYGVYLSASEGNAFYNLTISNLTAIGNSIGICLDSNSTKNMFTNVSINNLEAQNINAYGIWIIFSSNNTFNEFNIHDIEGNDEYAFYSDENSNNNTAYNITIASYPTTVSFFYGNGIALRGVEEEIQPNNELLHIQKFINITAVSINSWINITFHYTEQDIWAVNESSMGLYRYNNTSGEWEVVAFILNETHNFIKANLTEFSIYGIWGEIGVEEVNITLQKGWNLVTIPVILNWKAEDLAIYINSIAQVIYGFDICDTIVMLDVINQMHIGHPVGAGIPPGSINNFDIIHGIGYWIFVNQSITLNITGTIIKNITIDLQPGYNLLGWVNDNSTNASGVADKIENITMVVGWNNSMDDFITYLKQLGAIDFMIARGDAFYIFLAGESEKWYG